MESNKLGKKIRDWATNLGFRLPDGSPPSVDYFALLTATPHRRHLWEAIVESVLPRQKVEHMRKQILVAKFQDMMKVSRSNHSQQITDRIGLWHKQNAFETEIKEKRNTVTRLEGNILAKASDLVFEICKLAELEKQFEELNDKLLILKLFSKRQKKLIEGLENKLNKLLKANFRKASSSEDGLGNSEENLDFIINQLLSIEINMQISKCLSVNCHSCMLSNKIEEICKSGVPEHYLWKQVIKYKKNFLQQFSEFLIQLNSSENDIFSEKASEIEKNMNQLVTQLKQKMTAKSLQVITNSTKGKLLELEIKKLEERLMQKEPEEGNLNEAISFLCSNRMNESYREDERSHKNLRSYLAVIGLQMYREFLKEELGQFEDKEPMVRKKDSPTKKQQFQLILDDFESVIAEINSHKSEEKEIGKEILDHHHKLECLQRSLKDETERMKDTMAEEETAEKLKSASEKQIDVLLEIPLDAFRTFESSSGRVLFERESESHCLENYGGELKQFFSAVLTPPLADLQNIISEIRNRKRILSEVKKFTSDRENLASFERKIHSRVSSIKHDSQLCEKNFKEADGILWNTFSKTERLFKEIDFVEKILKSWVEQPYRLMVTEPLQGKTLKEFEEQYRKGKI